MCSSCVEKILWFYVWWEKMTLAWKRLFTHIIQKDFVQSVVRSWLRGFEKIKQQQQQHQQRNRNRNKKRILFCSPFLVALHVIVYTLAYDVDVLRLQMSLNKILSNGLHFDKCCVIFGNQEVHRQFRVLIYVLMVAYCTMYIPNSRLLCVFFSSSVSLSLYNRVVFRMHYYYYCMHHGIIKLGLNT